MINLAFFFIFTYALKAIIKESNVGIITSLKA